MSKNPLLNALSALAYIALVVFILSNVVDGKLPHAEIFAPVIMLSLLTLSAAVMGYIFLLSPLQLYLDGNKKQAVNLFLHTVGVFAGITALILVVASSGLIP